MSVGQSSPTPPTYTLAGTLHYLQTQWRQYERERNDWEIERADLRARVALLEGERRAQENVKVDLMRRIKMLELVLRTERAMYLAGTTPAPGPTIRRGTQPDTQSSVSQSPNDSSNGPGAASLSRLDLQSEAQGSHPNPDQASSLLPTFHSAHAASRDQEQRKRAREHLSQCLQEINQLTYAHSLRAALHHSTLLESVGESGSSENEELAGSAGGYYSSRQQHDELASHQNEDVQSTSSPVASRNAEVLSQKPAHGSSHPLASLLAEGSGPDSSDSVDASPEGTAQSLPQQGQQSLENPDNLPDPSLADLRSQNEVVTESEGHHWKPLQVLRHHLGVVRSIAFDENRLVLASGSDDTTIKYWNLDTAHAPTPTSLLDPGSNATPWAPAVGLGRSDNVPSTFQPVVTYRGHTAAVTSVLVSSLQNRVYSASLDKTIRVWRAPRDDTVLYAPYDPESTVAVLEAHTDAVWHLAFLPATARAAATQAAPPVSGGMRITEQGYLASVSADGTTKVWDLLAGKVPALKSSWNYLGSAPEPTEQEAEYSLPVPTAVTAFPSDWRLCLVGYSNGVVKAFEIETGKAVDLYTVANGQDAQINQMVVHPALPLLVTAHEDGYLRLVQLETHQVHALHTDLGSLAALDLDPAGLTLAAGGANGRVKFWDLSPASAEGSEGGSDSSGSGSGSSNASSQSTSASSVSSTHAPSRMGLEQQAKQLSKSSTPATAGAEYTGDAIITNTGNQVICMQDLAAHLPTSQEGVLTVAYHRSAPHFASAGADGIIRVYH